MISVFKSLWVGVVCAVLAGNVAVAQGRLSDSMSEQGTVLMGDYTTENIGAVLSGLQIRWRVDTMEGGVQAVSAVVGGHLLIFFPRDCGQGAGGRCTELHMVSVLQGRAPSARQILEYNEETSFVYVSEDEGTVFVQRYDFEHAGVPVLNLAASILAFRNNVNDVVNTFGLTSDAGEILGDTPDVAASDLLGDVDLMALRNQVGPFVGGLPDDGITSLVEQILKNGILSNDTR